MIPILSLAWLPGGAPPQDAFPIQWEAGSNLEYSAGNSLAWK